MAEVLNNKPTLGFFELTSCKGCEMQVLNANLLLLDVLKQVEIVYWPLLTSADVPEKVDIAVVEGAVSTPEQADFLKALRENSKTLIALGACACGLNKNEDQKHKPLSDFVQVDQFVRCCPVDTAKFIDAIQIAISGRNTFVSTATLCGECKSNEKGCFYGRGQVCAGLVSNCGCDSLCTKKNVVCRGCSGVSCNANISSAKAICSKMCHETGEFDSFLSVCDVDRFLDKDLSGLSGDDAAFVASRFDGQNSQECMLCAIETTEKENSLQIQSQVKNLRDVLRFASRAQNHVTSLICEDLREIKHFDTMLEFYEKEPEFVTSALSLRSALTDILEKIGGRAVHPITCKVGGFSVDIAEETLIDLRDNLEASEAFAVSLIDVFAKNWQDCSVKATSGALKRVLEGWDDLTDVARFGAAKASLRPPENDERKECIARAIEIVDAIERIKALIQFYLVSIKINLTFFMVTFVSVSLNFL